MLVFIGTYTDPILFGTGKILQGKGEGIYVYRLDPSSGSLEFVGKTTGIANPSYLAFDATQRFLYAVNELKDVRGQADRNRQRVCRGPDDGNARVPEPAAHARDRSLSRRRRPAAETRVRRQLHERQRVRPAGARRRQPGGGLGLHPASGVEHRSGAPERAARPLGHARCVEPLRLRSRSRARQADGLPIRSEAGDAGSRMPCPGSR